LGGNQSGAIVATPGGKGLQGGQSARQGEDFSSRQGTLSQIEGTTRCLKDWKAVLAARSQQRTENFFGGEDLIALAGWAFFHAAKNKRGRLFEAPWGKQLVPGAETGSILPGFFQRKKAAFRGGHGSVSSSISLIFANYCKRIFSSSTLPPLGGGGLGVSRLKGQSHRKPKYIMRAPKESSPGG